MQILAELQRRNVIRMAGLYLVVAWLMVQVGATLLPLFEAPPWVMRVMVALLAIGFLPALVFSWVFELTADGLKRDGAVPADAAIAPRTARRLDRAIIFVLLLAVGYFAVDKFVLAPSRSAQAAASATPDADAPAAGATVAPAGEASIAVLPFVNMSTDAENGFFADGISEELLNVLAGVDGLKVASRTSSFSFRGKDTAIPEIARQLGVQHVLEGSVRKQGQRVRITAQLIHAGSDGHLWSETYDRDLTDIFHVQEEIARAITRELEGLLGKRDVAVAASTKNLEAYQDFLRGRARFHRRDELVEAIEDLGRAVQADPDFAEAWVYLAAAWTVAPGYHGSDEVPPAKARASARAALDRAERLAPTDPMVPALQAYFLEDDGDVRGGLAKLEAAARLGGQDSTPALWQGLLLLRAGYVGEAIAVLEAARDRDPLSGINNGYLALAYRSAGRDADAEASARLAVAQGWNPALRVIITDLAARGENERAVALFDEFSEPAPTPEAAETRRTIREWLRDPVHAPAPALDADATGYDVESFIVDGNFDRMLDLVEQMLAQDPEQRRRQWWLRSAWLPSTLALREDPRFFAVADQLGLVDLWRARGWPDGCRHVAAAGGDHLDCAGTPR